MWQWFLLDRLFRYSSGNMNLSRRWCTLHKLPCWCASCRRCKTNVSCFFCGGVVKVNFFPHKRHELYDFADEV
jgi:hypothetical protein